MEVLMLSAWRYPFKAIPNEGNLFKDPCETIKKGMFGDTFASPSASQNPSKNPAFPGKGLFAGLGATSIETVGFSFLVPLLTTAKTTPGIRVASRLARLGAFHCHDGAELRPTKANPLATRFFCLRVLSQLEVMVVGEADRKVLRFAGLGLPESSNSGA